MKNFAILLVACFLFQSCATIYTGTRDQIHFTSFPQGATVTHGKKVLGVTPLTVMVHRTFKKRPVHIQNESGSKEINLSRKFNLWTLPTILTIIGPIVDIFSSSFYKYDKSYYEVDLAPGTARQYNVWEYFFVITEKGDTIYCRPIKEGLFGIGKKIKITSLDGKAKTVSLDSVQSFKVSMSQAIYEKIIPNPEKPTKRIFANLVMRNGEYSLYDVSEIYGGGMDMNGNMVGGGVKERYYVFKNNEMFSDIDKKKELIAHKGYFENPDFKGKPEHLKVEYEKRFKSLFEP
jgi:hypothetical protein